MAFKIATPNKPTHSDIFFSETGWTLFTKDDGSFYVSGCKTQKEADEAIAAHNPIVKLDKSIEEKLASVGLNINDLKAALGL